MQNAWLGAKYDQWWITGFNTEYRDPVSVDMAMIGSVDFSIYELIYEQVKNGFLAENNDGNVELIFDDEYYTIWFMWKQVFFV